MLLNLWISAWSNLRRLKSVIDILVYVSATSRRNQLVFHDEVRARCAEIDFPATGVGVLAEEEGEVGGFAVATTRAPAAHTTGGSLRSKSDIRFGWRERSGVQHNIAEADPVKAGISVGVEAVDERPAHDGNPTQLHFAPTHESPRHGHVEGNSVSLLP